MTLGTAALLLAVAVIGIMLTGQYLRERRALRMACGVTHTGKIGSIINVGVARPKGRATPNIFHYYQEKRVEHRRKIL